MSLQEEKRQKIHTSQVFYCMFENHAESGRYEVVQLKVEDKVLLPQSSNESPKNSKQRKSTFKEG
jgi:hypothetical protein